MNHRYMFAAILGIVFLLSFVLHNWIVKIPVFEKFNHYVLKEKSISQKSELQKEVDKVFNKINTIIPKINFSHLDNTTSAMKSIATVVNLKEKYCVGDSITVRVDMFDYLCKRKSHGGDFLMARIFSSDIKAAASGRVDDFKNGTYNINFTLFWQGTISFSILLIHPSEGVSALWQARNKGHGYVAYTGYFISQKKEAQMACGFDLNRTHELCEYIDPKEEEYFYCVKPQNISCGSLVKMRSVFVDSHSYLTDLEKSLFNSTNIRIEIQKTFDKISVLECDNSTPKETQKCSTGLKYQFPGGYTYQDMWTHLSCNISRYRTMDNINECIKGKNMHLIGDSTMLQWMSYLSSTVKSLKPFNLYGENWSMTRLYVDMERNVKIKWAKHANPFIMLVFHTFKEEFTISHLIDQIGGDKYTVIMFTLGMHFRLFPIHHFIRRMINIRRAVEQLFLRSPDTKVIIKTGNTSKMDVRVEMVSDFHEYLHYLIIISIFQGVNVGVVDAWDITNAYASNAIHPPINVIANEIDLVLSFIC
ncbi:NXPE family member 2-like [Pelodytes ibericus]